MRVAIENRSPIVLSGVGFSDYDAWRGLLETSHHMCVGMKKMETNGKGHLISEQKNNGDRLDLFIH